MTHTHHDGLVKMFPIKLSRKHHINVYIWKDRESMYAAKPLPPEKGENFMACAVGCTRAYNNNKIYLPRRFGELHFVKDDYSANVVAHEIQHMMTYWVQSKCLSPDVHDEKIADTCGKIHKAFWIEHYKEAKDDGNSVRSRVQD